MKTNVLIEYLASPIVRIEVHVERIDVPTSTVIDDDGASGRSNSFAAAIGFHARQPGWNGGHVIDRGQIDIGPVVGVELVKVVQRQRIWCSIDNDEVDLRLGMYELGGNVARIICVLGSKPNNRCCRIVRRLDRVVEQEGSLLTVLGDKVRDSSGLALKQ